MWMAHALAAALTIAFLRHAELAVWGMLTRAIARVTAHALPVVHLPPQTPPAALPTVRTLASRLLVSSASRRGPPLLSF